MYFLVLQVSPYDSGLVLVDGGPRLCQIHCRVVHDPRYEEVRCRPLRRTLRVSLRKHRNASDLSQPPCRESFRRKQAHEYVQAGGHVKEFLLQVRLSGRIAITRGFNRVKLYL